MNQAENTCKKRCSYPRRGVEVTAVEVSDGDYTLSPNDPSGNVHIA